MVPALLAGIGMGVSGSSADGSVGVVVSSLTDAAARRCRRDCSHAGRTPRGAPEACHPAGAGCRGGAGRQVTAKPDPTLPRAPPSDATATQPAPSQIMHKSGEFGAAEEERLHTPCVCLSVCLSVARSVRLRLRWSLRAGTPQWPGGAGTGPAITLSVVDGVK